MYEWKNENMQPGNQEGGSSGNLGRENRPLGTAISLEFHLISLDQNPKQPVIHFHPQ